MTATDYLSRLALALPLVVAACTATPSPDPTPSSTPTPTPSVTSLSPAEQDLANARQAVVKLWSVVDRLTNDPHGFSGFNREADVIHSVQHPARCFKVFFKILYFD